MPRLNENALPVDEAEAYKLSAGLTEVIFKLVDAAGYSIAGFAREIGTSRVRLSQIKNARNAKYIWRLPLLCAVSRVLGVPLVELIRAASPAEGALLDELIMRVDAIIPPGTPERLRRDLARVILLYSKLMDAEPEKDTWDHLELKYRCSPVEIEAGVPDFYKRFIAREMSEDEFTHTVWKALNYAEGNGWLSKTPFWVALKAVYKTR